MQLLDSWRESIMIFKLRKFKLFLLDTLKLVRQTYKTWLAYWWWVIGILVALQVRRIIVFAFSPMLFFALGPDLFGIFALRFVRKILIPEIIVFPVLLILFSALFLSARTSLIKKNYHYFLGYARTMLFLVPWFVLLSWIFRYWFVEKELYRLAPLAIGVCASLYVIMMFAWTAFFMLFLFDSDGSLRDFLGSLYRGFKMMVYNIPFCLIMGILLFILFVGINAASKAILFLVDSRQGIFLLTVDLVFFAPLYASVVTSYYNRCLRENFSFYF